LTVSEQRIVLSTRVRGEWSLLGGLLDHVAAICSEAWILDDCSQEPAPAYIASRDMPVHLFRAREWSLHGGTFGEGAQRDRLVHLIRESGRADWVLQLDCDERLCMTQDIQRVAELPDADAVVLPLVDYYITHEDSQDKDPAHPERVRSHYGPEVRWTLVLFRPMPRVYVDRGDARDPQGFDVSRVHYESTPVIEHYGKSVSVEQWEEKCRFYADLFPVYREKWLSRIGKAVHDDVSDFGGPLIRRGKPFSASKMPSLYRYEAKRGMKASIKSLAYGRLGRFFNRVQFEEYHDPPE
jgi:hypothetical protein